MKCLQRLKSSGLPGMTIIIKKKICSIPIFHRAQDWWCSCRPKQTTPREDLFIQRQASQQRRSTSNDIRHHLWATNTLVSDQDHLQSPACQPVISSNLENKTDSEHLSGPPSLMHCTCEMDSCSVGYCHRYWWVLLLSGAYWGTHPSLEMTKQAICRWCCWGVQPQQ